MTILAEHRPAQAKTSPEGCLQAQLNVQLNLRRVRLPASTLAATLARSEVRIAIRSWDAPVDEDTAVLLTSELVTNAVQHVGGRSVMLVITCSGEALRVDVHDTSRVSPVVVEVSPDNETGRGLMLVSTLSADWGSYHTPAGKAVYFTLALQPDLSPAGECLP
jgi:anti-sigma regulatory factor (Ser/Thr protein kinase)